MTCRMNAFDRLDRRLRIILWMLVINLILTVTAIFKL